jgi:hypothetical protein
VGVESQQIHAVLEHAAQSSGSDEELDCLASRRDTA